MMNFIKRKIMGDELSRMDTRLNRAFSSVDGDIAKIKQWISHLNNRHSDLSNSHKQEIMLKQKDVEHLSNWISYLHKHNSEVHKQVQGLQQYTAVLGQKVADIEQKMGLLQVQFSSVRTEPEPGSELNLNRTRFEERMLTHHIRPNKKNYVLKAIMDAAQEGNTTTKQLEAAIVQEKGLCGRTSFYGYLKELRNKGAIQDALIGSRTVLVLTGKTGSE